jgi:hypothetical protein
VIEPFIRVGKYDLTVSTALLDSLTSKGRSYNPLPIEVVIIWNKHIRGRDQLTETQLYIPASLSDRDKL